MVISDCFLNGTVCEIRSRDKYEAIRELIKKAPVFNKIEDINAFEEEIIYREKRQCTGFGKGVAVAHGCTGTDSVYIALGISREGINYNAYDKQPVQLLFVIVSPPDMPDEYLMVLSVLVKLVRDERFREELLSCFSIEEAEQKLREAFFSLLKREKIK
ncbi:MAG: PTS sugar transporter subunit IIA [Spirochaetes bacterium]|nr:MAG: PTS sugar transporter subunit IIA [Spirochaetota bacterium]